MLNQQATHVFVVNNGNANRSPFPLQLTDDELAFLNKQRLDKHGMFILTPENKDMLAAIKRKAHEVVGDPIDLSLNKKLEYLAIYLVGTLICAMNYEDTKYGPNQKFNSQLLYPPGENKSLYRSSIEELGRLALRGELPFNFNMIRPEVFDQTAQGRQGLNTITQIEGLLARFKIGISSEKDQQSEENQNDSAAAGPKS